MRIPRLWASDLAMLRLGGAVVEDHGDHVVIASPHNPGHHWGNFLLVTEPDAADDARRWVEAFDEHFPETEHVAIALPREPDPVPFESLGLQVGSDLALVSDAPLDLGPHPEGYEVRPLDSDDDWAATVALTIATFAEPGEPPVDRQQFLTRQAVTRRALAARGEATFLGAFDADGRLAAMLGIVRCGPIGAAHELARYQGVATAKEHRRRGLATHLLGIAGQWAAEHGADQLEIHVDVGSAAHRLYDRLGFQPLGVSWQAERSTPATP